jgi:hypothetical protein
LSCFFECVRPRPVRTGVHACVRMCTYYRLGRRELVSWRALHCVVRCRTVYNEGHLGADMSTFGILSFGGFPTSRHLCTRMRRPRRWRWILLLCGGGGGGGDGGAARGRGGYGSRLGGGPTARFSVERFNGKGEPLRVVGRGSRRRDRRLVRSTRSPVRWFRFIWEEGVRGP